MAIDRIIRNRLINHSYEWHWDGERFLKGRGVTLCKSVIDDRWTFVVGDRIGYIKLSRFTHACIEMARILKSIEDKDA